MFAGANIAMQGCFQALENGLSSLIISLLRQFVLVIPVAYILAKLVMVYNMPYWILWFTFIFAEGVSTLVSIILLKKTMNHIF